FHGRLAAYLTHYNETRTKKSPGRQSPVQYRRSLGLAARPSKKRLCPMFCANVAWSVVGGMTSVG
ncbi:hypothetical protein, partial [Bifidobacterium pullorum]|uniref:hypothetical protein n=1 Tax=Bifidobacterium pullorum TaxID=78448 RepID=UPI00195863BB